MRKTRVQYGSRATTIRGKSVVVVLGMHRSGTSAITRGLEVLGVDLGKRLMAPMQGVNEKGFFEDIDVNAINVELYQSLGRGQDWHTLALIPPADLLHARHADFRNRAIELLESRLRDADCFGIKDPRLCRFLPFWQDVFEHLQIEASYVIALRNPLSVAKSLQKRDGFPLEKCFYLWLEHVVPSVLLTAGRSRVVIDYDHFLDEPGAQLYRIARVLGPEAKVDPARLAEFSRDFLDDSLRHMRSGPDDVYENPVVPDPVKIATRILADAAVDKVSLDSAVVRAAFNDLAKQLNGMAQAMSYAHQLDQENMTARRALSEQDERIKASAREAEQRQAEAAALARELAQEAEQRQTEAAALTRELAERDGRIKILAQEARQLKAEATMLVQELAKRDAEIKVLAREAEESEIRAANLSEEIATQGGRLEALTQALAEREARAANLSEEIATLDGRLEALTQALAEREAQAVESAQELGIRDGQIQTLMVEVGDRKTRMTALAQDLSERNVRISALQHIIRQKEAQIQHVDTLAVQLQHRLRQARAMAGWRYFRPAQILNGMAARLSRMTRVDLIPYSQLQAEGAQWLATGGNPQFLFVAQRAWSEMAGWYWLEVDVVSGQPMDALLYFELGEGFDSSPAISIRLLGTGRQRIPLYVRPDCHAIRLDPGETPARFSLCVRGLVQLKDPPVTAPEVLAQPNVFDSLSKPGAFAPALAPARAIQRQGDAEYSWRSEDRDPWFAMNGVVEGMREGWYRVVLRIRSSVEHGNARLYFDHGNGCSEADALPLPFNAGELVERLYRLDAVPRAIRFDPIECKADFSVERLHFVPVTPRIARDGMLERMREHVARYRDCPPGQIWLDMEKQAAVKGEDPESLLYRAYNQTFTVYPADSTPPEYEEWIDRVEMPEFSDTESIEARQKNFRSSPLLSVIMPTYNTAEKFLRLAIDSVCRQSYANWELCIADDASSDPHVRSVIEEYARRDSRINVTFRQENGHISAASNSALAQATGDYVALLDHDDELSLHALHFVAEAINRSPSAQVIYSDEDKINERGDRSAPHFKPDWNPDLFLSQNYVAHLCVYRRDLLQRIGGFRLGVEGSQDHDLLLRCLPHVKPDEIVHIPKVLYHWRMLEESTAFDSRAKRYTAEASIRALENFFGALGQDVKVKNGLMPNTYRVHYPVPQPEPLVSLLIPTRDHLTFLEPCVRSIIDKTTYRNFEIVILDNASTESSTLDYFGRIQEEDHRVRVIPYPHPFNFSAINNFGVQHARGELIGLVNNDVKVISPGWLTEMVSHAARPEIGCVGAKLYYQDETIQHAGVIVGLGGVAGHSHKYFPRAAPGYFCRLKIVQNLSAVTGACLVVRKAVYEQVGGLEETGLGIAFNDVDFCLKVREAGYRNLWTPHAELYHYESKSRGTEDTPEKIERFNKEVEFMKAKWGAMLQHDPCYSPNLTLAREDFSLRG